MILVAFLAILVPLLGGLAGVVYVRSVRLEERETRDDLLHRARAVAALLEWEGSDLVVEVLPEQFPEYRDPKAGVWLRIRGADGRELWRSPSLGDRPFPSALVPEADRPSYRQVHGDSPRTAIALRVTRIEERDGPVLEGKPVVVEVAVDTTETREQLGNLALFLSLASAGGLLLGIAAVFVLSRMLVRPLARMSETAAAMSPATRDRARLEGGAVRELDGLARTLNEAFARLDAALAREKRFVADASHELRTPLSTLLANAETGLRRVEPESPAGRALRRQVEVARRLSKLTDDLLVLARLDSDAALDRREPVSLAAAVAAAAARAKERLGAKRIRLAIEPEADPGYRVLAVREDLERAVANLLSNAVRHGPEGSEIRIRLARAGDRAILTVADEGPGVAAADLPHLFERFYRADPARTGAEGSGLGLSIVRSIVERLGGTADASNASGGGAVFRIELPLADPRDAARDRPGR